MKRDWVSREHLRALLWPMQRPAKRNTTCASTCTGRVPIAIHRRSANHRSLASCLNNLGDVHRAHDDIDTAEGCFESLRVAEQRDIGSTRAFALVNLGLVQHQRGKPTLALRYAQRARAEPPPNSGRC